MKIKEVVDALEHFAPLPLQESYDNAGLQIGLTEADISGALLCLDVTEQIVDEALAEGCNLIVAHHPLIFRPLRHITGDDYVQRTVAKAIRHGIAIVAMHTNLDNAEGGVCHKMAEKLGMTDVGFLVPGNTVEGVRGGSGVIGTLPEAMAADDFILTLRRVFATESVQCNQLLRRPIRRVALCGGAGSFLVGDAARAGADAFVTGEMHYHEFFGYEQQLQIAVIGHYQSEQYTNEIFKTIIRDKCGDVRCCLAKTCTNPIIYL